MYLNNDPFYFDNLLDFDDTVDEFLNCNYFWDLFSNFNNPLNNVGDFDYPFNDSFNRHYFLYDVSDNDRHFERYINDSFNFFNFLDFDDLLDDLLDSDDLRNLDDSVNDLFDDLLNLNYFWNNSKDFENIINIHHAHDFLVDHSDDSLIHF